MTPPLKIPHDRGAERYVVSALLENPALLDDERVKAFEAIDILDPLALEVFSTIRNMEATGKPITAASVTAAYEARSVENNGPTGHRHHPELDELIAMAPTCPPSRVRVHQLISKVSSHAAARREMREDADAAVNAQHEHEAARLDATAGIPITYEPRKPYHRAPNLTRAILERSKLPWITLRLAETSDEITRVRIGAYVVIVAPEGSGKSSLLLQIGTTLARTNVVFVYFTVELDEEEAAGRIVGQTLDESWETVLRGNVPEAAMARALDLPRLTVIAGEDAVLGNIERTVEDLRKEHPDLPIVVGVDYIQAIDEGNEREERSRVTKVSKRLRKLAKSLGVVIIGVSQTSRGNREKLRSGEAVGADTTTMGAEASQLERDAYVTMALGGFEDLPDGTRKMDLSIGKTRMGQGDKAFPVIFDGRSGRFSIAGAVRSGSELRAERASKDDEGKVHAATLAIPAALAAAPEPMHASGLARELTMRPSTVREALRRLQADAETSVVRVRWQPPAAPGVKPRKTNGAHPFWTMDRATAAGLEIFPAGFGGTE